MTIDHQNEKLTVVTDGKFWFTEFDPSSGAIAHPTIKMRDHLNTPTNKLHGQVESTQVTTFEVVDRTGIDRNYGVLSHIGPAGVELSIWVSEGVKIKNGDIRWTEKSVHVPEVVLRKLYENLKEAFGQKDLNEILKPLTESELVEAIDAL